MMLKLTYLGATALARHYRHANGVAQWVPRSVCPRTLKHGDQLFDLHEVTIEDWWLQQNPFERKPGKGQRDLL